MATMSVVLATYNGARFVQRQIDGILGQTVAPMELLIGDDRSTDDTVVLLDEILRPSSLAYDLAVNEERLGVIGNFERLVSRAQGDVIVLCDQDDEWAPNRLSAIQDVFDARSEVVAVFSDADLIGPGSEQLSGSLWDAAGFTARRRRRWPHDPMDVLMEGNFITGATLAFRSATRDVVLPISRHGWHDFWISALLVSSGIVVALEERLISYRLHGNNQIGVPSSWLGRFRSPAISRRQARHDHVAQLRDLVERFEILKRPVPEALTSRLDFVEFRDSLPASLLGRCAKILGRGRLADYWRFSSGALSLGLDVTRGGHDVGSRAQA